MLLFFSSVVWPQSALRFYGNGVNAPDLDRVKIQIDEVDNNNPGPPADIGAQDFTIEFWIKAQASDNLAGAITCGSNINWIYGNIILDRDRYNQQRKFGVSITGGVLAFGVSTETMGDLTLCGSSQLLDNIWHHVAVQRRISDGFIWIFIDGLLDSSADGPEGDISYPDGGIPCSDCCGGSNCNNSDPYLVIGAEKHDAGEAYPAYNGFFDELRLSNTLRYTSNYVRPQLAFTTDAQTAALYHFDEGIGTKINDASASPGGPSPGILYFGGNPAGPVWSSNTPFTCEVVATNQWKGPAMGDWHEAFDNWSLSRFPDFCDDVLLDIGINLAVSGSNVALAHTLSVPQGSVLSISLGSAMQIGL